MAGDRREPGFRTFRIGSADERTDGVPRFNRAVAVSHLSRGKRPAANKPALPATYLATYLPISCQLTGSGIVPKWRNSAVFYLAGLPNFCLSQYFTEKMGT